MQLVLGNIALLNKVEVDEYERCFFNFIVVGYIWLSVL